MTTKASRANPPPVLKRGNVTTKLIGVGALVLAVAACGAPPAKETQTGAAGTAKSASELGGMDKLVEAAKKEGKLNVIALPPDWANYGKIIEAFEAKYGVKVDPAKHRVVVAEETDRTIMLLAGDGVHLRSADGTLDHRLATLHRPFAFSGDLPLACAATCSASVRCSWRRLNERGSSRRGRRVRTPTSSARWPPSWMNLPRMERSPL